MFGLLGHATKEVAATDYDGDLDAQAMHLSNLGRNLVYPLVIDTKTLSSGQRLA